MIAVPESHLHGQIPFEYSTKEELNVLNQKVSNPLIWGSKPVSFTIKAGQISLHTDLLLHGSQSNHSNRRRSGLTLRYMPSEVRTDNKNWDNGLYLAEETIQEVTGQTSPYLKTMNSQNVTLEEGIHTTLGAQTQKY